MNAPKMNRATRRAAERKAAKGMLANWTPLVHRPGVSQRDDCPRGCRAAWSNDNLIALVYDLKRTPIGDAIPIGVRRVDGKAVRPTFYDMQRVKDQLAGTDAVAVEVYPPAADLVDAANLYWMLVLPGVTSFPFPPTGLSAEKFPHASRAARDDESPGRTAAGGEPADPAGTG